MNVYREEFERPYREESNKFVPGLLERTIGGPGILRDYKNQEIEMEWRGFQRGYLAGMMDERLHRRTKQ